MEEANKISEEEVKTEEVKTEEVKTETEAVEAEAVETEDAQSHEPTLAEKIELAERGTAPAVAKQKMNLPNKLTLTRIALVPVMVVLFYIGTLWTVLFATIVFIIAAATDFFDGYLARKHDIVTDFGKFLDPIADKLLVVTAIIMINSSVSVSYAFLMLGISSSVYVMDACLIIIVAREFAVSGLRLVASNNGTVIAADKLGKIKTLTQTIALPVILLSNVFYLKISNLVVMGLYQTEAQIATIETWISVMQVTVYAGLAIYLISTIICLISGIQYLVKNKQAFLMSK